jgi:hypothetical protein
LSAQKLISRADLARRAGCKKSYVTKALNGPLKAARVAKLVDANHPTVRAWLAKRKAAAAGSDGAPTTPAKPAPTAPADPTPPPKRTRKKTPAPTAEPPPLPAPEEPPPLEEVDAFIQLLGPLAEKFATSAAFKVWLAGLEGLERYRKARLDNDERAGRVIDREYVRTRFFAMLDTEHKLLLTDTPRAAAGDLTPHLLPGAPLEEVERIIRDAISAQLEATIEKAAKAMHDAH